MGAELPQPTLRPPLLSRRSHQGGHGLARVRDGHGFAGDLGHGNAGAGSDGTADERELSDLSGELPRFLKPEDRSAPDAARRPALRPERRTAFRELSSEGTKQRRKGLVRLVRPLHAVVEAGEAFPVWRHRKDRGARRPARSCPRARGRA